MNKSFRFIPLVVLASSLLVGCGKGGGGGGSNSNSDGCGRTGEMKDITNVWIHYTRPDGQYDKWNIWAWDLTNNGNGAAYEFNGTDSYGVYADILLSEVSSKQMNDMGFIVRTNDWDKDPDGDRSIKVAGQAPDGIKEIWVKSGSMTIYDNPEDATKATIKYAILSGTSDKIVNVTFENLDAFQADRLVVKVDGIAVSNYTASALTNGVVTLTFTESINLSKNVEISYQFDETWTDKTSLLLTEYFDSDEFKTNYTYTGNDLGATLDDEDHPTATTFKLWAPTSSKVTLNLYHTGDYRSEANAYQHVDMTLGEKGVYSTTVNQDLTDEYYTYTVKNSLGENELVDPYAKSAGLNGQRGMVVNFKKINDELMTWASDTRPAFGSSETDASIYEVHVRDMTINENSGVTQANRGKFLGLAEKGTSYTGHGVTVSTGLDHIKELGVTHVQIQPFYDYKSVQEENVSTSMSDQNYNWGYDPQNYNCLEGGYSTNPVDGNNRIIEFKRMMMAMHEEGLNVNMDVVYNHTFDTVSSNFNKAVPYYYYRTESNGTFYNGSGCGNEVASERSMVRKFILDSVKFYAEEYHMSGFRFDLMGLEDNQTMIDVYDELKAIDPNIMVYGEPWTGGTSKLSTGTNANKLDSQQTVQNSLNATFFAGDGKFVGAFNDQLRDAIKGSVWKEAGKYPAGWVQGASNKGYMGIKAGILGKFTATQYRLSPRQVLQYVSCHDNNTLFDQINQTNYNDRDVEDMISLSQAMVFFSQGVPFFQEGDDFMRTKKNNENSYNVGDSYNNMDYDLKAKNVEMFDEFKEIIAVRNAHPEFRFSSQEAVSEAIDETKIVVYDRTANPSGNVSYTIDNTANSGDEFYIIHCLKAAEFALEKDYVIVYSNMDKVVGGNASTSISLADNETIVLRAS